MSDFKELLKKKRATNKTETYTLEQYLKLCSEDSGAYASASERMLKAIGEPEIIDTSSCPRLSRIFSNRKIKRYDSFKDFYGLEEVIEKIVSYFKHAAQGLEESKQVLYLLGPVGSAKSSIAERLKKLMEQEPIYVLTAEDGTLSPIFESPLGIFSKHEAEELGIPARYLKERISPWALKRLEEYDGDVNKFKVTKLYPSQAKQIAIAKTEPGDDNNQDISALVGKLDIRKLEFYAADDPDAYRYNGGLCLANQGLLEFVEMFKAPIKVLHPLLTATQEGNFNGTEAIPAIPFNGIILAHSNESEWETFKNNKNNEAFLDRICVIKVPYNLRIDEEIKILDKLINTSDLIKAPCAPGTLEMLAKFTILSRLDEPENSNIYSKLRVYNGDNIKDTDPHAKSLQEYKDLASVHEGFRGVSTRTEFKILSQVFNYDTDEIAANPVHMLYLLEKHIEQENYPENIANLYYDFIKRYLAPEFAKKIGKDIQTAYLSSYDEYGQAIFDRYIVYADHWVQDHDYRDPDTGEMYNRDALNEELTKVEKPAKISNPKDFRHEVVNFAIRYQSRNKGKNPKWTSYEKLREVIEANMFSKTEDLLPVISFSGHADSKEAERHQDFVKNMIEKGYTEKQVRLVVEWHNRYIKSE